MIYAIIGPTASNKSLLAEKLHERLPNSLIVNFDAYQIYKELDIGSAKPKKEELDKGYYRLYNYLSLNEENNIYLYQGLARKLIIDNKDKDLIFVGGSGLYLKAALFDYRFNKEEVKFSENHYLNFLTNEELYSKYLLIDEEDAVKIGKNNRKRLIRGIYLYELNNKNKEELNLKLKDNLLYPSSRFIFINPKREELYSNINLRVDKMILEGLKDEALSLIKKYGKESKGLQGIGYKEFFVYDETKNNLEEIIDKIKLNTRRYAKRQITFFKNQFKDKEEYNSIEEAIKSVLSSIK